jgi:hypothetical protein
MTYDVVSSNENFRGLSYGNWVARWSNWLLSEQPDYQNNSDVLFLRGNIAWKPSGGEGGQPRTIDPKSFYNRTGELVEKIFHGTAVIIPVITAMYFIADRYAGTALENEEQIRYAARTDINEGGPMYARIREAGQKDWTNIVADLKEHLVETPLFKLMVSESSPLLNFLEYPMTPGIYDAVTVGHFLILKNLAVSTYRIQFGGKGRGYYRTDSVYDIAVTDRDESRDFVRDISPGGKYGILPYTASIPDHPDLSGLV